MADFDSNEDERAVELSAIAAIFPELIINPLDPFSASIELPVCPAQPLAVTFVSSSGGAISTGIPTPPSSHGTETDTANISVALLEEINTRLLSHLPPLILTLTLPNGYPTEKAPIIRLDSRFSWVPEQKINELMLAGRSLWEDLGHDQIMFTYIDYLQQAAEDGFGLNEPSDQALELSPNLEISLPEYDLRAKRTKFEQETFECGICLEPKKGLVCHRLFLCGDVFCVACLQDFYNACITEGDVTSVKCLAPKCAKEDSGELQGAAGPRKRKRRPDRTLDPSELLQIPLKQETVQRYVKLKRKNLLESDRTTVYCPRQWCQGAARSKKHPKPGDIKDDEDSDSEADEDQPGSYNPNSRQDQLPPPNERLSICEDCSFAFCKVCKASWHGEFAVCFPRKQYELSVEEKASEDYLKKHSTACPTCAARCQKTMGCNHMICFKCNSHFCYLCSSWLSEENPYKHFNTQWTPCYMRLWELEEGDGIGVDLQNFRNVHGMQEEEMEGEVEDHEDEANEIDILDIVDEDPPPALPGVLQAQQLNPQAPEPPPRIRVNVRVQQELARPHAAAEPHLPRGRLVQGLQRFLQMVENDEEDEWDSDELDGDEEGVHDDRWVIPVR